MVCQSPHVSSRPDRCAAEPAGGKPYFSTFRRACHVWVERYTDGVIVPGQSAPTAGSSVPDSPLPKIADHDLLHVIGRGAYGEVWLARHTRLGTLRAIKMIRRDQFGDARPFTREFDGIQKYEPISRSHPNLVSILHVGGTDDCFYYVMELADPATSNQCSVTSSELPEMVQASGRAQSLNTDSLITDYSPRTLRSELKQHGALPTDRVLEIAHALASALAHLHAHKLVHRDVKPSNVIFVGGVAKLADIGLVAGVDDARSFVGTEGYVPFHGAGRPSADCYSLGKLLYELSTGHDRTAWPEPPADLATRPDRERLLELNAIVHRACAPDPRERYTNGGAMLGDLELLQRGQSVKKRRVRQQRWAICKKAGLSAVLVALAATVMLRLLRRGVEDYPESPIAEVNILVDQGNTFLKSATPEGVRNAMASFNEAIKRDPKFIPAYWGLFGTYVYQRGMAHDGDRPADIRTKIHTVAKTLMQIDPNCAESLCASASVKWSDWQIREALAEARLATQARARCKDGRAWAHGGYGFFLELTGHPDAALEQYKLAEKFSPSDSIIESHVGHAYFIKGDFEKALNYFETSSNLKPRINQVPYWKGKLHEEEGKFLEAIDEFQKDDGDEAGKRDFYEQLRSAVRQDGAKGYWGKRLSKALNDSPVHPYYIATLHARLGEWSEAYKYLEQACEQHDPSLDSLMIDFCWDHEDEKFKTLAKNIGLMQ